MSSVTRNEVLKKDEACAVLNIAASTLAKWAKAGWLERAMIGNRWFITLRSIRPLVGQPVRVSVPGPYKEQNRELVRKAGCSPEFPRKSVVDRGDNGDF